MAFGNLLFDFEGLQKTIHLPFIKKKGQVSNCDVTLELWTQKAQLADGKSVQSAYQKLYIPSLYINGI